MPRKKSFPAPEESSLPISRTALTLFEAIGLAVAVYLSLIAFHLIHKGEIPCPRGSLFACGSVVRGMFSKIGPVSIALMGVAYFAGQLILTGLLGKGRFFRILKVIGVFGGLLFVAWLRSLELVYLKKLCPWCWGVAFAVLVEAALVFPLAMPPFPPLRIAGRLTTALLFLFAFLGLTTAVELLFKPSSGGTARFFGWTPSKEDEVAEEPAIAEQSSKTPPSEKSGRKTSKNSSASSKAKTPNPQPTKTPKTTAQASPSSSPAGPTPTPPSMYDLTPTPEPAATAAATAPGTPPPADTPAPSPAAGTAAAATTAAADPEPPIEIEDVPELHMLQQRGWRMVATGERLEQLIRERGPVLLMVYDPYCEECHATMNKGLNSDAVDQLPVTRIAMNQSYLSGNVSAFVQNVPTLLLINSQGIVLWKHEARIAADKLVKTVTEELTKPR